MVNRTLLFVKNVLEIIFVSRGFLISILFLGKTHLV